MIGTGAAVQAWIDAWTRAWASADAEPLRAVYAEDATMRALPFREEQHPVDYARWAFADQEDVEFAFGEPLVAGDRAAVEYWAVIRAGGREETVAGVALLRFAPDGRVVTQRDYWVGADGRRPRTIA